MTNIKEKTDKISKAILFLKDDEQETRYVTAKFEDKKLVISFTNFNHVADKYVIDYRYKFNEKETQKFIKLLANGQSTFLQKLQEKFNSSSACADLIKYADENDISYKFLSGHEGGDLYRYELSNIYIDEDLLYDKNKNLVIPSFYEHPKNGVMKLYLKEGSLYMSISYKNNKKNGFTKCYSKKTKKISWEENYTNDLLDGITKNYYNNGTLKKEETFVMGVKEGWEHSYNEDEGYLEEAIMYANNVMNGAAFKYYKDGQVKHEAYFKDNKQEGITKEFYESGIPKLIAYWKDGKRNGIQKEFYETGELEFMGYWKNNKGNGLMVNYHKNGKISAIRSCKNDIHISPEYQYYEDGSLKIVIPPDNAEGIELFYYPSGVLKSEVEYKNENKCGFGRWYYENGKIEADCNYKNDKRHGICKEYHYSGKLRLECEYKNGKKHGIEKRYYNSGQLSYEHSYKNGLRNGYSISYIEKTGEIQYKIFFRNGKIVDFYGNDGITGVQGLAENNKEEGGKAVNSREMTEEEKELWKEDNLLTPIITNKNRTACVVMLYNTVLSNKPPFIVEKLKGNKVTEFINSSAHSDDFIVEDNDLLEKLLDVNLSDRIPRELYEETGEVIRLILDLQNKYNIKKALIRDGEILVPNDGIDETKKKKNKNLVKIKKETSNSDFSLDLVNCSRDIKFLTNKIITNKNLNFSMCIYGDPGTGKSAYARYLADKLGINVVCRTAADILDQYVGNSEKQIAEAFEEAEEKKAMLIIDEVDSFLRSRGLAQRNWEVTIVNQMLTCMEKFNYPFICTTNFIDSLDQASLRRFTFKFKFGFLMPDQIEDAFNYVFKTKPSEEILKMKGLTVSDFVNIKKECDILGITDMNEIAKMLDETISLKESEDLSTNIGFN